MIVTQHLITFAIVALLGGAASAQQPGTPHSRPRVGFISEPGTPQAMSPDDVAARFMGMFEPPRDAAHPARNRQLVIPSGPVLPALGRPAEMNALFFLAAGAGPHPTMLLMHGLPGNERNLDLAQAVRRSGWNVLTFTYRGAWGSEGRFSIEGAMDDTAAALAFLRSAEAARTYGIDPSRIVIAGHSMGGFAAAATAARDSSPHEEAWSLSSTGAVGPGRRANPPLAGLILIDAWDIGTDVVALKAGGQGARAAFLAGVDDIGHALGPVTAEDLYGELVGSSGDWHLARLAPALARTPVLTLYATHGGARNNRALAEVLRGAGARVAAQELDTDHAFADHRIALAAEVVGWLQALQRRD